MKSVSLHGAMQSALGQYIDTIRSFSQPHLLAVDDEYAEVAMSQADGIIHWHKPWQFWIQPAYKSETRDCDDLALKCMYETRQAWKGDGVLPFGIVAGTRYRGQTGNHAWNVLVCTDGVLMYDVQSDVIWRAKPEMDRLYFAML